MSVSIFWPQCPPHLIPQLSALNLEMRRVRRHFPLQKIIPHTANHPRILFNSRSVELCSLSQPPAASLLGVGNECHLVSSMLFSITHSQDAMRRQKLFHGRVHWEKRQINSNVTNVKWERHFAQSLWCFIPFVHRCAFINSTANGRGHLKTNSVPEDRYPF